MLLLEPENARRYLCRLSQMEGYAMSNILGRMSWLFTVRPYLTLLVLIIIAIALAAGATRRAPPPETAATLPEDSPVAAVLVEIDELFGDSGEANVVTLLFRGEALTPDSLSQMDSLISERG